MIGDYVGDKIKTINIIGTGQRYQMKNAMKVPKQCVVIKPVGKMQAEDVANTDTDVTTSLFLENQMGHLECIIQNKLPKTAITVLIENQLKKKMSSYKQQDILKKRFNNDEFIKLNNVINLMNQTKLCCYYCDCQMYILYEYVREKKQWTLDRIDNQLGHTVSNIVLSCLECNLKRRRIRKDDFIFTKNLTIIKSDKSD